MRRRTAVEIADLEDRIARAKASHVSKQEEVQAAAKSVETYTVDVAELILKRQYFTPDQQKSRDKYYELLTEMNEAYMVAFARVNLGRRG